MIRSSKFGYALRHSLSYNPRSRPGSLTLWSSYNGSTLGMGTDPIKNGDSELSELVSHQFRKSPTFGTNIYVSFSIGSDDDVFSILAAIRTIKQGRNYSFKNYAGREFSFSKSQAGNQNREVILVNIRHKTETGILTLAEVDEFEKVTINILAGIGYSKQQITEKVKLFMSQSALQEEKSDKSVRND